MNRFYGYEVVHFGRNCAKWAPWRWQALDKMTHQNWRVGNRRLEIEYANALQRSRMVLIFFANVEGLWFKEQYVLKILFPLAWCHFDEATSPRVTPPETDWSPQRYIMTSRSLTKKILGAFRRKGQAFRMPWKSLPMKTCQSNIYMSDSIFLTELDFTFLISVALLVSLQVTSHNWLSNYIQSMMSNWRCKIPANFSNITAWWILCKSAWFERCTNIGNIYLWNTTQDATSSTLDLVKKAKGWKFHPRGFCRKNGELHHVEKVANIYTQSWKGQAAWVIEVV